MSSKATEKVAEFVVSTSLTDIDAQTQDAAARVVMDTVGVMLAGVSADVAPPLQKIWEPAQRAGAPNVVGFGVSAAPEVAAMVNGTLGHALDYDDVIELYPGHPSAVVVGALLASAEPARLRGDAMLEAYILGVEAGARIGQALGDGHYLRGYHATSSVGIFGAVLALAKLRGFSVDQTRRALGIAGSMAGGLRCNFGTMTKPLHSGWAAHSAVMAAELAGIGYTANESVFEAGHGFFAAFGDEHSDASAVSGTLGNPYLFTSPGVSLKLYPCYNGVHRAIDAAREIVAAHPIDPASVESITCLLPPGRLQAVLYHHPTTGLEGKFSYEYVVAAAVLDGTVGIGSFSDEAVNRPQIQKLMSAVVLREDPACTGVGDEGRMKRMGTGGFMRVVVRTHDGEEYSADVARALGSPSRPLTWEHVEAKFGECARWAGVDDPTIVALTETLRGLPEAADVRSVVCGPQVAGVPHT